MGKRKKFKIKQQRGKSMNPLLVKVGVDLVSRIIDSKKAGSKTNVATAAGLTMGATSFMTLIQSDDPVLKAVGALLILISAGLTFYREKKNESE